MAMQQQQPTCTQTLGRIPSREMAVRKQQAQQPGRGQEMKSGYTCLPQVSTLSQLPLHVNFIKLVPRNRLFSQITLF
jgi:hypothetical protein